MSNLFLFLKNKYFWIHKIFISIAKYFSFFYISKKLFSVLISEHSYPQNFIYFNPLFFVMLSIPAGMANFIYFENLIAAAANVYA